MLKSPAAGMQRGFLLQSFALNQSAIQHLPGACVILPTNYIEKFILLNQTLQNVPQKL